MWKNYAKFIFVLTTALNIHTLDLAQKNQILKDLCSYKGQRTFLLSYPRSGNTWTRYCLEYLTKRASFHRFNLGDIRNRPLAWISNFDLDYTKPPIEKAHTRNEISSDKSNKLILIIRNPKEVFSRHGGHKITLPVLQGAGSHGNVNPKIYFQNIEIFDSWPQENRFLIFYEDLLTKPKEVFTELLLFLNESLEYLELFMQEYSEHRKKAIEIYKESKTEGNDLLFYSRLMPEEYRKQIDIWIEELYQPMWNKYLKVRYAEENLTYEESPFRIIFHLICE